jgi:hypothetical protein
VERHLLGAIATDLDGRVANEPSIAEATLDCRVFLDTSKDVWLKEIARRLGVKSYGFTPVIVPGGNRRVDAWRRGVHPGRCDWTGDFGFCSMRTSRPPRVTDPRSRPAG